MTSGFVSDELRSALFVASRCVVYPSIHYEPFGMVPVEAMAYGTPVVVPDRGGITEAVQVGHDAGGLVFRTWDSAHLAGQIERLLSDEATWQKLSAAAPRVAAHFSVERLADRILDHVEIPDEQRLNPAVARAA